MARFDPVGEHMQDLFVYISGVLADVQKVMLIRRKAGNIFTVFKYPVFTFIFYMVNVFTHFEMMYFLIPAAPMQKPMRQGRKRSVKLWNG